MTNNTHPSNLKVRRLTELPQIPQEEIGESVLYATANNKDYKVGTTTYVDAVVEQLGDELAGIGEVRDEAVEAREGAVQAATEASGSADAASAAASDASTAANDAQQAATTSNAAASLAEGYAAAADSAAADAAASAEDALRFTGSAMVPYETAASLPSTDPGEGKRVAWVWGDSNPDNNGAWAWDGGWSKSLDRTTELEVQIGEVDTNLSARMKLGRAVISGNAFTVGKTSSRYMVVTREGSLYVERNAGQRAAVIAAVTTPVEIAPHQGLVVDFENGPVDGNGAYIPQVQNIASSSAEGWQSGSRYILVGRDANGALFGEYDINGLISPFDGEIAVAAAAADGLPTWDQATRTLTWPELVIATRTGAGGDPSQSPRILLSAGSVTVPDSQVAVVYLDLSQVVQAGTPASAVIAVDYLAGPRMEPGGYLPLFAVGRSFAYPVRFPPTVGSASLPAPTPVVSSGDLVLTADSDTRVHVHSPLVGEAGLFMRWTMERLTGSTPRDMPYDVWQIRGGALATVAGNTSTALTTIVDNGQLEYAIRKTGDSGFDIGGQAHGNDIMDDVVFLVEGAPVSPADLVGETRACRRFEVVQHSTVTDTDSTTHVADRTCRWVFEGADLFLTNRLAFVNSLDTTIHYAPMPSVVRLAGTTQITDRAMRSPEWIVDDVSGAHSRVNTNSQQVLVWGQDSGLSVDTEILDGWEPTGQVHISSALNRNKVYFEVDGPAPSYAPGDVTSYTARIRISRR